MCVALYLQAVSAVRVVDLGSQQVTTVLGGLGLGKADGPASSAKMQFLNHVVIIQPPAGGRVLYASEYVSVCYPNLFLPDTDLSYLYPSIIF